MPGSTSGPTPEQIRIHYELERRLSDRIRNAPPGRRSCVTLEAYDELFRSIPWHPANNEPPEQRSGRVVEAVFAPFFRLSGRDRDVLEIGCGTGRLLRRLAPRHRRYVGIDISEETLAAEELPPNAETRVADAVDLAGFADRSFDVVISSQLMEHFHPDDVPPHLAAVRRVLRPGGRFIFETPSSLTGPHDISRHFDRESTCFHLKEYDFRSLRPLLKAAGFRKVRSPLFRHRMYARFPWLEKPTMLPLGWYLAPEALASVLPRGRARRWASHLFSLELLVIARR